MSWRFTICALLRHSMKLNAGVTAWLSFSGEVYIFRAVICLSRRMSFIPNNLIQPSCKVLTQIVKHLDAHVVFIWCLQLLCLYRFCSQCIIHRHLLRSRIVEYNGTPCMIIPLELCFSPYPPSILFPFSLLHINYTKLRSYWSAIFSIDEFEIEAGP